MVGFGTLVDKEACNYMEDMDCDKAGLILLIYLLTSSLLAERAGRRSI
jgi:hypothetical protein